VKKKSDGLSRRQLDFIRDLKRKIAADCARRTREYKKGELGKAVAKDKVETYGDVYGILCGLSRHAMEVAAMHRIETLAAMGYSPAKIIELMEVKKGK
jgi:hypothetical protein